jgi:plastocyanin
MRKLALSLTGAALLAASVPAVASPLSAESLVKDNFFKPKLVTIKKGGTVLWRWKGSNPHNVAIKKPGSSKVVKRSSVKTSGKYDYKFRSTGTWRVLCEIHPVNMRMKVVVKSS